MAGYDNCDGDPSNGCEANLNTDPNHCGSCAACRLTNATASCTNGSCTIAACQPNTADCDNNAANGCESPLQSDATHCGSCGNACNTTNGTATCSAGNCGINCNTGFANCDGNVSNGCEVDLSKSVNHCGTCSTVCQDQPNGTAICTPNTQTIGKCDVSNCQKPFGNCDNDVSNGCEANEDTDPNNCGGCGNKCAFAHASANCALGVCGISACDPGFADCNGNPSDGCEVNLNTDTNNCKACGAKCAPANAVGSCVAGACTVTSCTGNFQNCDGDPSNGCEADVATNASHCGTCSTKCDSTHGTPGCSAGICTIACATGYGNCDGNVGNGCEATTTNDPLHCGTCGTTCVAANSTATCLNSACTVNCTPGFSDCDTKYSNGCESNTNTDTSNCGSCNNVCSSANGTAACYKGACSITCSEGFGNCDTLVTNGCETNLNTSMQSCGGCGQPCAPANASSSAVCTGGNCTFTTCNTGFANCNATTSDGCEANLTSDAKNCNGCGTVCNFDHASASCNSGACLLGACDAGYANCDSVASNGCEANLQTDPNHCNGCSTVCAFTNASATCVGGACTLGTCNAGFSDCDHSAANGCEANLNSDVNNCGGCGTKCDTTGGTPICSGTPPTCGYSNCSAGYATCPNGATCGTNTTNDVNNCGGCGNKCSFNNATASCQGSTCTLGACTAGFDNCDKAATNGCEVNLKTDVDNCSVCGNKCAFNNAAASCESGACKMGACNAGFADCDNNPANGCEVNLNTDVNHCNGCTTTCSSTNGTATCNNGTCGIVCTPGFADCDNNPATGCEVNTNTDPTHCGSCPTVCNTTGGTATCTGGVCGINCSPGFGNCDNNAANGCEVNTTNSVNYCGSCTNICAAINGIPSCSNSACSISCTGGYNNCDGNFGNGCESLAASDTLNCGACGNTCTYQNAAGVCTSSVCHMGTCNTGYGDCNTNPTDGCEAALITTSNCGTCSNVCGTTHASQATCSSGTCNEACDANYANCDGVASNGCEINTSTDVNHCGSCPTVCPSAHATPACTTGTCSMTCVGLWGDCNTTPSDGCEKDLSGDTANCGACNKTCSNNHGTPACSGGGCSISCTGQWGNCDGDITNGCEKDVSSDTAHCGNCTNVCPTGQPCVSGVCQPPCTGICTATATYTSKPGSSIFLAVTPAQTCLNFTYQLPGYVCGNSPTSFAWNGTSYLLTCNGAWQTAMPSARNGGYCLQGSSSSPNSGYVNF